MKFSILYIGIIFLAGCYNIEKEEKVIPEIINVPDRWSNSEYENDYNISQIWPAEIDSSLYHLLNDFSNNNKDILLLELKEKISETYYKVSSSNLYPEISLGTGISKGKQNLSAFGLNEDFLNSDSDGEDGGLSNQSASFISTSNSFKMNTSWELDLWGRLKDSRKASLYTMNSELYNVEYAKISLKAQFIKLYLKAIFLNDRIKISEQNLKNLEILKEISKNRVLQGISNPDEIHIASANYYIYESKLIGLKEQYKLLQNNIQLMLGQYLQKKEKILYQYPCDILEINSDINATLLERRIDVLSAKEKILSSKSRLKSDKKIFFPNINLTTSAGYASSNLEELINENFSVWNIGMNILEPIFKGGEIKNSIKISEYNLKSSEIEYIKVAINAIYEADNILYRENNLREIHQKVKKSKNEIEKAFQYAINSYELGLIDLVYLLTVQQQIYDISIEESKVHLDRYLNRVNLILSLGGNFEYE